VVAGIGSNQVGAVSAKRDAMQAARSAFRPLRLLSDGREAAPHYAQRLPRQGEGRTGTVCRGSAYQC